jgi:hypothetical protein
MLAATLVAPGHDKVVPLEPEFIVPQDGAAKQDCENMAAKRWLATHGQRYAAFDPVYLGDDLFSRQPLCQAVHDTGGHFIFVCKPSSHPQIQQYLTGIDLPAFEQTVKRGKQRFVHHYRSLQDVTLHGGSNAMAVNWFDIQITNANGETTYRNSFVTSSFGNAGVRQPNERLICLSVPTTSSNLLPAAGRGGRSRTRPSTS